MLVLFAAICFFIESYAWMWFWMWLSLLNNALDR